MSIQLWRVLTPTFSGFFSFLVLTSLCGFCSRVPVAFTFVSKLALLAEWGYMWIFDRSSVDSSMFSWPICPVRN